MDNPIIYRPHRAYRLFVPFMAACAIFAFIAFGFCIADNGRIIISPDTWKVCLLFAVMGIMSVFLTKVLYDSAKIIIVFNQEGLRIIGDRRNNYRYLPWDEFSYAYYGRSFKGHTFLVLSPLMLDAQRVKKLANYGANTSEMYVNSTAIIYMDHGQDTTTLEELIKECVKEKT